MPAKDTGLLAGVDMPVFILSGGFIVAFVGMAMLDINVLSSLVSNGAAWASKYFGAYWQLLLLATFLVGLTLAVSQLEIQYT